MLDNPDGQSERAWWFQTDASQFNFGLVTAHEARLHVTQMFPICPVFLYQV